MNKDGALAALMVESAFIQTTTSRLFPINFERCGLAEDQIIKHPAHFMLLQQYYSLIPDVLFLFGWIKFVKIRAVE